MSPEQGKGQAPGAVDKGAGTAADLQMLLTLVYCDGEKSLNIFCCLQLTKYFFTDCISTDSQSPESEDYVHSTGEGTRIREAK